MRTLLVHVAACVAVWWTGERGLRAAPCEPGKVDPDTCCAWIGSKDGMDAWIGANWCGLYGETAPGVPGALIWDQTWKEANDQYVWDALHLSKVQDTWLPLRTAAAFCNPDQFWMRLAAGALLADWVGIFRQSALAAGVVNHDFSPRIKGNASMRWTAEWVAPWSDTGWTWTTDHPATIEDGTCQGWTVASNPMAGGKPSNLYYAFFGLQAPVERSGTLVHEIAHEVVGHLPDSACAAKGSCDRGFQIPNPEAPNAVNAQTATSVFLSQAIETWRPRRKDPLRPLSTADGNFGEPVVASLGPGECGYLPLLSEADRDRARILLTTLMSSYFEIKTPQAAWPYAARLDVDGRYLIDGASGARWPCTAVCSVDDYTFDVTGKDPKQQGCNEQWQPANVAVNAHNRQACQEANAKVAGGVTPAEHAKVLKDFQVQVQSCRTDVPEALQALACDEAIATAPHVHAISANYPIKGSWPGFNEWKAIQDCEERYCEERWAMPPGMTPSIGQSLCWEVDLEDPVSGCPGPCGPLDDGATDAERFEGALCRWALMTGRTPPVAPPDPFPRALARKCVDDLAKCSATRMARMRWEEALAAWKSDRDAGQCWFDALPAMETTAPTYGGFPQVAQFGTVDFRTWIGLPQGQALLQDPCFAQHLACEAMREVAGSIVVRAIADVQDKPYPPPYASVGRALESRGQAIPGDRMGAFYRGLLDQARSLAGRVQGAPPGQDLRRAVGDLVSGPDQVAAMARLIGPGTLGGLMGSEALTFSLGVVGASQATTLEDADLVPPLSPDLSREVGLVVGLREQVNHPDLPLAMERGLLAAQPADLFVALGNLQQAGTAEDLVAAWEQVIALAGVR